MNSIWYNNIKKNKKDGILVMKLLAIDGNSILNRAFYGVKPLSNKNGVYTNAIFGFMNIYMKNLADVKPDCVAIAFDMRKPTFRHKAVDSYKANRKGMPDELAQQLVIVKDLLCRLGISVLECEGFEADDILGTLARICTQSGNECVVLTGDRDSLQLINDNVTVYLAGTKETKIYDRVRFVDDYGFEPINLIDLKALMGDSSDNIKGVAGVGEKTASTLIREHGTIENIYENLENVKLTPTLKSKVENGKEDAFQSKWLATIVTNAPICEDVSAYIPNERNEAAVSELLTELEMFKLMEKLNVSPDLSRKKDEEFCKSQIAAPVLEFVDENSLDMLDFSTTFAMDLKNDALYICQGVRAFKLSDEKAIETVLKNCANSLCFNAKAIYRKAFSFGFEASNVAFDAEICAYLLKSSPINYGVKELCASVSSAYFEELGDFADAYSLFELCELLKKELCDCEMEALLYDIEQPLTKVLASMEHIGVEVDTKGVDDFGVMLKERIAQIEQDIYEYAGGSFNIASPKQLGEILFERLSLPYGKKTKTGYSTNAEVLEKLSHRHPIVPLVLEYRQLTKLNSTYVDGLLKTVMPDGRIHTNFKQTETRTGRISSTEPNMQNIPVRTELGRNMRKFFKAQQGRLLIDADYSQIELRLMAHICGDENMIRAFAEGADIHASTASQVFDMPLMMVTKEMRSAAKAVNFGIIYGIGAFSLSKDIGVSIAQADKYIKDYFRNYPKIKEYMDKTVDEALKNGYITTMFGRRRYIPEIMATNKNIQSFGKRAAMNAPIQGSAADIIKIAMVNIYKRLKAEKIDAQIVLQVHDELIIEASTDCADAASRILVEEMCNAASLSVPLVADVSSGTTWFEAKA